VHVNCKKLVKRIMGRIIRGSGPESK